MSIEELVFRTVPKSHEDIKLVSRDEATLLLKDFPKIMHMPAAHLTKRLIPKVLETWMGDTPIDSSLLGRGLTRPFLYIDIDPFLYPTNVYKRRPKRKLKYLMRK